MPSAKSLAVTSLRTARVTTPLQHPTPTLTLRNEHVTARGTDGDNIDYDGWEGDVDADAELAACLDEETLFGDSD